MSMGITRKHSNASISDGSEFPFLKIKNMAQASVTASRRQTKNEILANLPSKVYGEIEPYMQRVSIACGETIYEAGGEIHCVYFPDNLVASRLVLMEDGSMIEVGMFGHEAVLGVRALMGSSKTYCLTVAETKGSAIRIEIGTLKRIFNGSAELQKAILQFYEKFLVQVSQRAACRSRHTISKQLCTWLLQFQERISGQELFLTQETIANRLGARRSSITIAINELETKGIISGGRGNIEIRDRQALLREACECYSIIECEQSVNPQVAGFH